MNIFTITTFYINDKQEAERPRTIGYMTNFEGAEKLVFMNAGDMHENGYYNYVVIEEIEEGIYSTLMKRTFYKWVNGEYVKLNNFKDPWDNIIRYAFIG